MELRASGPRTGPLTVHRSSDLSLITDYEVGIAVLHLQMETLNSGNLSSLLQITSSTLCCLKFAPRAALRTVVASIQV